MIISVKAKPNSSKQQIKEEGGMLIVSLKEKAEDNKANRELINLLSKYCGKRVKLKYGLKSRIKKIEV